MFSRANGYFEETNENKYLLLVKDMDICGIKVFLKIINIIHRISLANVTVIRQRKPVDNIYYFEET